MTAMENLLTVFKFAKCAGRRNARFYAPKRNIRSIGRSINLKGEIRVWLYRTDDSIAMSLRHHSDLTTVRAWSWTNITFDHRPVSFLHNHGSKFSAFASRRLVSSGSRTLCKNSFERFSKLCVKDAVDDRIEGRVAVAEPSEYLLHIKLCFVFSFLHLFYDHNTVELRSSLCNSKTFTRF